MIEKLIELNFDGLAMQGSNIELNQANRNSVIFYYKIYKGSSEINYSNYNRAQVVFQKRDGRPVIDDALISPSGISYILRDEIFDLSGLVAGQVNLYTDDSLSATLLYNFKIVPDQANIALVSRIYIGAIENLLAELTNKSDDFLIELQRLVDKQNEIMRDIDDENFVTYAYLHNYTVDGGFFLDSQNPIAVHDVTPITHTNMLVDGGTMEIVGGRIMTLEEHVINQTAHQNLIVDGNNA